MKYLTVFWASFAATVAAAPGPEYGAKPLVSVAGQTSTIPAWSLQSTKQAPTDLKKLSKPGADVSSWHRMGPMGTVMDGLLQAGVYDDRQLFFSDNLQKSIDYSDFQVPWLYREEFQMQPSPDQHYFLETNGITSRADLYINGHLVADKSTLVGAYGGKKVDITRFIQSGSNAVLVQAYPTNYLRDFALGFVDWNPYPPDNGTGVWREIQVSQTGPVSIKEPRAVTDFKEVSAKAVVVTVKVDLKNNSPKPVTGQVAGHVQEEGKPSTKLPVSKSFSLKANEAKTVVVSTTIKDPKIWWPRLWGAQPLYTIDVSAFAGKAVSDTAATRTFGIRHITSAVNSHNDTAFTINGQNFQVIGAGYSSDMFLRLDEGKLRTQFEYMLDMSMNTVRLEGKEEHPYLFDLADRIGLMVLPGWECCDKWEGWEYNDEADGVKWTDVDYTVADWQVRHEARMLQGHASILGFLVGSDYWPNDRATKVYVDALNELDFGNPIVASAAKRGYPELLGPSGMKMDGPYDWVPPNYWYGDQLGAAFGFGSELGAGVGTPELPSLKKFLSKQDLEDLWRPATKNKGLYHMSTNVSQFFDRKIYNKALYARYGTPTSLEDYLWKAQMSDYEATKSEYEGYAAKKNAKRPATGVIYWMLNNAWPSLHWNLFDYYLAPAGSYYGAKAGARPEHVAYDYDGGVWLINQKLGAQGPRTVDAELLSLDGERLAKKTLRANTVPNQSKSIGKFSEAKSLKKTALLKLSLKDQHGAELSRNVYWLAPTVDKLDWSKSTWYYTPVTEFADFQAMQHLKPAKVSAKVVNKVANGADGKKHTTIELHNESKDVPAVFVRLMAVDAKSGEQVLPVQWQDNYMTLWPGEKTTLAGSWTGRSAAVSIERATREPVACNASLQPDTRLTCKRKEDADDRCCAKACGAYSIAARILFLAPCGRTRRAAGQSGRFKAESGASGLDCWAGRPHWHTITAPNTALIRVLRPPLRIPLESTLPAPHPPLCATRRPEAASPTSPPFAAKRETRGEAPPQQPHLAHPQLARACRVIAITPPFRLNQTQRGRPRISLQRLALHPQLLLHSRLDKGLDVPSRSTTPVLPLPPHLTLNTTYQGIPTAVPNKHIPYSSPGPVPSYDSQLPSPPASPPSKDSQTSSLLYPPDRHSKLNDSPPVYGLTAAVLADAVEHAAKQPLPDPKLVFPWMHGLHPDNQMQLAFFNARRRQIPPPPACLRALTIVKAGGDMTTSKLKGAIAPDELLAGDLVVSRGATAPRFKDIDPRHGFSVRNFQIQAAKVATISDIVVYGDDSTPRGEVERVAALISRAQRLHYRETNTPDRFNTFMVTDDFGMFTEHHPEIVAIDPEGCLTGEVIEFSFQERFEMCSLSKASEIAPNVWLGPTPDPTLYDTDAITDDEPHFHILIETTDFARMPKKLNLDAISALLAKGTTDATQLSMEFPSSGSMAIQNTSEVDINDLISFCRWLHQTTTSAKPARVLIHCADGYTETSMLALAYFMYTEGVPAHEAWIRMHNERKRDFFAYSSDKSLLEHIERKILLQSPALEGKSKDFEPCEYSEKMDGSLPSRILPYLYLGNLHHAQNPEMLRALGITRLLSVGEPISWDEDDIEAWGEDNFLYIDRVQDNGVDPLTSEFEKCLEFIAAFAVHVRVAKVGRAAAGKAKGAAEARSRVGNDMPRDCTDQQTILPIMMSHFGEGQGGKWLHHKITWDVLFRCYNFVEADEKGTLRVPRDFALIWRRHRNVMCQASAPVRIIPLVHPPAPFIDLLHEPRSSLLLFDTPLSSIGTQTIGPSDQRATQPTPAARAPSSHSGILSSQQLLFIAYKPCTTRQINQRWRLLAAQPVPRSPPRSNPSSPSAPQRPPQPPPAKTPSNPHPSTHPPRNPASPTRPPPPTSKPPNPNQTLTPPSQPPPKQNQRARAPRPTRAPGGAEHSRQGAARVGRGGALRAEHWDYARAALAARVGARAGAAGRGVGCAAAGGGQGGAGAG
ncbi:hypothetical protein FH972_022376 [Carpinus fangiana]|uniref:Tyrosine specific protein phosphatases domain-containing protein n=1 Tax=Carpinus fangiana TaxID=176857 RepID=A0A5N6KS33_9ROSI|nr:hypothetical protein FH972_022376 [Carpinus fangiana]